ncbi:cytochrome P450 [Periconia macrospinosa]|uniref:Cytochrome P450 n=1 Tax=Periconia macrospinosa TaxID=97972 RepID=A0A2V1DA87_9PLEO|nr:cytochrome P450 [Periconia macrospinosa]
MLDASAALAGAAFLLVTVYLALLVHLRVVTQDPREPPLVETRLPYITPLLNLVNARYFSRIRRSKHPDLPIYTLRLPGTRIYVLNSTKLVASTQRHPKNFTFQAIQDKFAHLVCNLSPTAVEAQKREFHAWINGGTYVASPSHAAFKELLPGKSLDDMNRKMVAALGRECDFWAGDGREGVERNLFEWVKEVVTVAVTEGVYGAANPYRREEVRNHFWTYNAGVGKLSMGAGLGKLLARDSLQSRAYLASIFQNYYSQNHHLDASGLTFQRYAWHRSRGFSLLDTSNMEVGHGIAILSNTVPTAFWLLVRIFSSPSILSAIRAELSPYITTTTETTTIPPDEATTTATTVAPVVVRRKTLDVSQITTTPHTACPLLHSTLKETMRVHGKGVGVRGVLHDHVLDGKYLLRANSIVLIPSTIQHFDPQNYGPDAAAFRHDRFAEADYDDGADDDDGGAGQRRRPKKRLNGTAFRGFGGGSTLCPGRHFAVTGILAFVAMVVCRFEVGPVVGGREEEGGTEGEWVVPSAEKADLTKVMPCPDFDVRVRVRRREGEEGVGWCWGFNGGGSENEGGGRGGGG